MNALGLLAALFWAVHAASHVAGGTPYDLLWACNVATPLLAIGCFLRMPRLCAVAVSWLSYGVPIWLLDLATGASLIPTSVLTHIGGLALGVLAVRRLGWPRLTWALAVASSLGLVALARLLTDGRDNVMLAFRVHEGWERHFGSHLGYLATMIAASAVVFVVVEAIARRFLALSSAPS